MPSVAVTAVIIAKNEAAAIERCIQALVFCDQVVVVDSQSADGTGQIARRCGAEVANFVWDGKYPKKKQWGMELPQIRNNWVLHLDADEVVSAELAREIETRLSSADPDVAAYELPLEYHFDGRALRYGHRVWKRALVDRTRSRFPEVDDLSAPGITEVEGHYQPVVNGEVVRMTERLVHDDPDPVGTWITRHNRYSDWEAHLRLDPAIRNKVRANRSGQGQAFDRLPLKPLTFFLYSFVLKRGFLDGRAGFNYAVALSWYYWLIEMKVRDVRRAN